MKGWAGPAAAAAALTLAGCAGILAAGGRPGAGTELGLQAPLPAVGSPATQPVALGADAVEMLTDGALVATRLRLAMDAARRTVHAEIYEFDRPDLVTAMVAARRRGVEVEVIADPTVAVNAPTLATLRAAGATVLLYPDVPRQIDHVKLLVVDSRRALFGGMNWGAGSYLNHDFELAVEGPAAASLDAMFAADMLRSGARVAIPPTPDAVGLRLVATTPGAAIRPQVLRSIASAERYVFVEMFVMTDRAVITALTGAADRGVAVFVLFDPGQDLNAAAMLTLRQHHVATRFYRSHGEKLHAKAMVVDGVRVVLGSANWTKSGFAHNHELDAVLDSAPLAAVALLRMERDWRDAVAP